MTEWPQMTLGDICAEGGGFVRTGPFGSQLHQSDYTGDRDSIPVVMPKDMAGGRVDLSSIARIDKETAGLLSKHLLAPGDVALARRGDVGRSAWIGVEDVPVLCGTGSMRVHPGTPRSVRPGYLRYFFRSRLAIDYLEGQAVGATMPNLNAGIVRGMPVPLLPIPLQEFAATVLGTLDDLIENNRRRAELLEDMAQAIYREWFVRFRYPGHEDAPLVDSPLGPIPDGWNVASLEAVANVNRRSRTPTDSEEFRYLDISALGDHTIGSLTMVKGEQAPGRARRIVKAGDVVWSMVRPNRRAHALLVDPGPEWIASTGLAVLSPKEVTSTWLFETTSTQEFTDYLVSQEGGAAYPAVKPRDFQRAPIVIPRRGVDQAFADLVAPMHRLSWYSRRQCGALAALRDLLLPGLVTGQIDVSSLDLDALAEAATA